MKALVLGGTGFVGMNVVTAMVDAGHDVWASRRPHGNTLFARKLGAQLVPVELDDRTSLIDAMRGREVVFNCAGHYPRYSLDRAAEVDVARRRARAVVDAALMARVRRLVLTSSIATHAPPGAGRSSIDETDVLAAQDAPGTYHAVKLAIEEETLHGALLGLEVVVLCPTGIFGALDVKVGTGFVVVALGRRSLPWFVDGKIDVVDAEDVAAAHVAAATRGRSGERYIVGGHGTTVRGLLEEIALELDVPFQSFALPGTFAAWLSTLAEMRCVAARDGGRPFLSRELVDVVRHGQWVDRRKSVRELGLAPPTPLATTVRKACAFYRKYGYLGRANAPPAASRRDARETRASRENEKGT